MTSGDRVPDGVTSWLSVGVSSCEGDGVASGEREKVGVSEDDGVNAGDSDALGVPVTLDDGVIDADTVVSLAAAMFCARRKETGDAAVNSVGG